MSALLDVRGLTMRFAASRGAKRRSVTALDGVDLDVARGETLGVVGESGCGKSTLARCALRLLRPTAGTVRFGGDDITHVSARALRPYRRRMQIVFQDPMASLNPRLTAGATLAEPLLVHRVVPKMELDDRCLSLLSRVGLDADVMPRFPHELSAGQRQRLGIARALAVGPELIAADEPLSALDVSVQAQVMNLLLELRAGLGLSFLFISHDLAVVRHLSDRVAVMYLGRVVELAPARALYEQPAHPYTRALLAASSRVGDPNLAPPPGEPADIARAPRGCAYAPRCPLVEARCREDVPALRKLDDGRRVACHVADGVPSQSANP